jgi:hypothetical protein
MADPYSNGADMSAPAQRGAAVNLAADTTFTSEAEPRGIWVGGAGNIVMSLVHAPATFLTFTGVQAGTMMAVRPAVIRSTANGTSATGIVALW